MNKILNWIYNKLGEDNDILLRITNSNDELFYVLHIKNSNSTFGIYIFIKKLIYVLITLIIFLIFYKYDIQLISENYIVYIKTYLSICFILYIGLIIYKIIMGFYESIILKQYTDCIGESVLLIIKLIIFFVNMEIFYRVLNLNIELFLQYNILLIIDLVMIVIFWYYRNILGYEIKGSKLISFLNYPWIMLIIIIILIKLKFNLPFKYFGFFIDGIAIIYSYEFEKE